MTLSAGKIFLNGQPTIQQPAILVGADYSRATITANQSTLEVDGDGATVDNCSMTPSGLFMRVNINGTFYRMPLFQDN